MNGYLWLLAILIPAAYAAAGLRYPGLALTSWLERVPWPRLPRPRLPRRKTPPRAHGGGTGEPCTGPRKPHETGARRLITRVHGWLYPATGQHSAAVLRLGVDGLWHDAATGPFTIPADYGTTVTAAERMWRGLP